MVSNAAAGTNSVVAADWQP